MSGKDIEARFVDALDCPRDDGQAEDEEGHGREQMKRMGGAGQKRGLSASAVGDSDRGTDLQLTLGTERQAW